MIFSCRKIFDISISPFEFGSEKIFHFLEQRFINAGADVQEQSLCWLQVLRFVPRLGFISILGFITMKSVGSRS